MKNTKLYKNKYRIPSARLKNWDYRNNGEYFITICTGNKKHYFGKVVNGKMQLSDIGKLAYQFWAEIPQHFPFIKLGEFIIMPNHTHGILIMNNDNDIELTKDTNSTNKSDNYRAINRAIYSANDFDYDRANNANIDPNINGTIDPDIELAIDRAIELNIELDIYPQNDSDAELIPPIIPPIIPPMPIIPPIIRVQTLHCNVSSESPPTSESSPTSEPPPTSEPSTPNPQMKKISPKPGSISTIIRSYKSATTKHARKINADFGWQTRFYDHIIRNEKAYTNISNYIINNPQKWGKYKISKS